MVTRRPAHECACNKKVKKKKKVSLEGAHCVSGVEELDDVAKALIRS